MDGRRSELVSALERYYAAAGWKVRRSEEGVVRAAGPGGVDWIGMAVLPGDFESPGFEERLLNLADERMPSRELCPLELLPDPSCDQQLRTLLDRLGLAERGHVEVYSLAA